MVTLRPCRNMAQPALPPIPPPLLVNTSIRRASKPGRAAEGEPLGRPGALALRLTLLLALQLGPACMSHEEVLNVPGAGGTSGVGGVGAAAGGALGVGGTSAGGAIGGTGGTTGTGGIAAGGSSADMPGACTLDTHCPPGSWCLNDSCLPCEPAPACPSGWQTLPRNGCDWCVPENDCTSDEHCGDGYACYPGQTCLPGCEPGDPACCYGNLCDAVGCGTTEGVDCLLVGCPEDRACVGGDEAPACLCDADLGTWLCSVESGSSCE